MRDLNKVGHRVKVSNEMRKIIKQSIESEHSQREKFAQKERDKNNPNLIRISSERKLSQAVAKEEDEVCLMLAKVSQELIAEIYNLIKEQLGITNGLRKDCFYREEITTQEIKKAIDTFIPALKKLKLLTADKKIMLKSNNKLFDEYEKLFNSLIRLDIRFAEFAPLKSIDRVDNLEKAKTLPDSGMSIVERKNKLEKNIHADYVSESEITNNDKINEMVERIEEAEQNAYLRMAKATENLGNQLYQFIVKELNLQAFNQSDIKYANIDEMLKLCSLSLKNLEKMSANAKFAEVANWQNNDPFTILFNRLIDIHLRFAIFAPKNSLKRLDIDYSKMSDKEKYVMYNVLKQCGLWEDPEFMLNYKSMFGAHWGSDAGVGVE